MSYMDPGKVMNQHFRIRSQPTVGAQTRMVTCKGECRRPRSFMQFAAGSTVCIRCVRRST